MGFPMDEVIYLRFFGFYDEDKVEIYTGTYTVTGRDQHNCQQIMRYHLTVHGIYSREDH